MQTVWWSCKSVWPYSTQRTLWRSTNLHPDKPKLIHMLKSMARHSNQLRTSHTWAALLHVTTPLMWKLATASKDSGNCMVTAWHYNLHKLQGVQDNCASKTTVLRGDVHSLPVTILENFPMCISDISDTFRKHPGDSVRRSRTVEAGHSQRKDLHWTKCIIKIPTWSQSPPRHYWYFCPYHLLWKLREGLCSSDWLD